MALASTSIDLVHRFFAPNVENFGMESIVENFDIKRIIENFDINSATF